MKIKGVIEDLKIFFKVRKKKRKKKKKEKNDHKNSKNISRTFSGVVGIVGSVNFWIVPWSPSYVVGTNYRVLIYCTCHFQGGSLGCSFCLLVSSVSDFHPNTRGRWWTLFRLTCSVALWEGGTLQTNNTGVCS